MEYKELQTKVLDWAKDKGIFERGTTVGQAEKTLEEAEELLQAVKDNDKEETIDALGDVMVTVIIQAEMQGVDLLECLKLAYNVIAKRKGKMENGQFVKD